jgi:23S rRNA (cytidine1920-2'-O)/16S rRNA (cytidine1409-2'-O)-methyltransferase
MIQIERVGWSETTDPCCWHVKMRGMAKRKRVDQLLLEREIAKDLEEARLLVMAGKVYHQDQVVIQPSLQIAADAELRVLQDSRFVSRGGEKLQAAFEHFPLSVDQLVCADIGASTGGFTDCLLQHGAARVYAIDVGYGLLDWGLRNHPRVLVMERTNARKLSLLPEEIDFFSVDVSFISLKKLLPQASRWYRPRGGEAVILIKPQFEASREEAARGEGVIRDAGIHRRILTEVLDFASRNRFQIKGLIRSPLLGPDGNCEFLAWLGFPAMADQTLDLQLLISGLL